MAEQAYYIVTGIIGWRLWLKSKHSDDQEEKVVVTINSLRTNMVWLGAIIAASAVTTWALRYVHIWMPSVFTEPASLPAIDAATTVMSFAAQILMIQRRLENWVLWIVVDVIAVWLYWYKGVPFVALLYLLFLGNAIYGFITWRRNLITKEATE